MSKLSDTVFSCIQELFPYHTIIKEYYVNYKNTKLFFDFYIKDLGVLIECQGEQHQTFVKHFHDTKAQFLAQKKRDNMKIEFLEDTHLILVFFYDKVDNITPDFVINKIYEAQCGIPD